MVLGCVHYAKTRKNVLQTLSTTRVGARHGEKIYETLLTREEMARSTDIGNYFRVQADIRGLNYDKYFTEGEDELTQIEDYHSHNVQQLDVNETVELLLKLPFIQSVLCEWSHELTAAETSGSKSHWIQRAA